MREGETRTLRRERVEEGEVVGMEPCPVHCTGKEAPLPTMIREEDGEREESIPELPAMCDEAPVSNTQSVALGGDGWSKRPVRAW